MDPNGGFHKSAVVHRCCLFFKLYSIFYIILSFFCFFWSIFIIFISRRFDPFGMYSKWLWQLDTLDDATAALPPGSCGNMTQGEIPGVLL